MITPDQIKPPFQVATVKVGGLERIVPYLPVNVIAAGATAIDLSYHNSLVRIFGEQPEVNHVEWREHGILKGIHFSQDVIQTFLDLEYPRRWDPWADDDSLEWFIDMTTGSLDDELDALGGSGE